MEPEILALTLPIRRLVEFLLRTGSIDSRFTGFDRALEGARLHRKLQRAAVKEYPDYQAEAALKQDYTCAGIAYTLEGRADGIFTDKDGTPTIDEIKTTTLPPEFITGEQSPEHWAQAQIYAAIYARQQGLPGDISAARGRRRIDARISPAGTDKRTGYCGGRRASAEYPVILTEEKTCIF